MIEKDYGEWVVPTKWEDVTLRQLVKMDAERALDNPSLAGIIGILCNKSVSEVEQLPVEFVESIVGKMGFIREQPDVSASCSCHIGDEVYSVNVKEKLKLGEWVAFNSLSTEDPDYSAKVLAIVCRKDGEVYDSKFENEVLPERVEMFLNAPCTEVLGVIAFFLNLFTVLETPSHLSSLKSAAESCIQTLLETTDKDGDGKPYFTNSQRKKLKKLAKYIRQTF